MGTFKYNGFDVKGKIISGTVEAAGLQAAIAALKERGLTLSDLAETRARKGVPTAGKTAPAGSAVKAKKSGFQGSLPLETFILPILIPPVRLVDGNSRRRRTGNARTR